MRPAPKRKQTMNRQRNARTRFVRFVLAALNVAVLTGCSATPFSFGGSPTVAALKESDIEAIALQQAARARILTDREDIRQLLNPALYVSDDSPQKAEAATGYETVIVTFLAKPGAIPPGQHWGTRADLWQTWKEWDNRVTVNLYHAPEFARVFKELMP